MEWIKCSDEMPKPSDRNKNFSDTIMLLVGKRKYKGFYNFHRAHFSKDGFHIENYIFNDGAVSHWRPIVEKPKQP